MKISIEGASFIRRHEGFVSTWYVDPVGVPTLGVGFTWASAAFREWWAKNRPGVAFKKGVSMTRVEADACLQFMCAREYGAAVNTFFGKDVAQHIFDGTTSPVFNMGPGSLKWTWATAIKAGDIKGGAARLRTTGTTARGVKLRGLVRRREEEARLLEFGDYGSAVSASQAAPVADDAMADGVLVKGERGPSVAGLQKALAGLGLYGGALDGLFGFGTEAAVLAFQRTHGLKPDGFAGPKTLALLKAGPVVFEPVAPPKSTNLIQIIVAFLAAIFGRKS